MASELERLGDELSASRARLGALLRELGLLKERLAAAVSGPAAERADRVAVAGGAPDEAPAPHLKSV